MRLLLIIVISLGVYLSTGLPVGSGIAEETTASATDGVQEESLSDIKYLGWKQDENGWRYYYTDTYLKNVWLELDEKFYYAGEDGYILTDTITPDGGAVDENGAWIIENTDLPPVSNKDALDDMLKTTDAYIGISLSGQKLIEDLGDCYIVHDAELWSMQEKKDGVTSKLGVIDLYVRKDVKLKASNNPIYTIGAWEWVNTSGEDVDVWELWRIEFDGDGYVVAGWLVSAAG